MERPVFKPMGTPVEELDTPVLVVDVDVLDRNIETLHSFFRQRDAKVRPHVESHRCPAIAHRQLAAGGTANGISVTTVGEAEVFAQQGFSDIFVANEVVTPQKIGRLCSLARQASITVAANINPRLKLVLFLINSPSAVYYQLTNSAPRAPWRSRNAPFFRSTDILNFG